MIWLQLFYVYLKIGIFGFGGGYAMLSLIQADVVDRYGWISSQEFTDIVAISQMTPGPIGINSATYIGYTAIHNAGYSPAMAVLGSCLTTFAVCLPSFLLVLAISYAFAKFRNNKYVAAAFYGLRPATVGLIAAAALLLMNSENFIDYKSFLIFGAAFILTWKFKINPILMIILAGIAGIVLYLVNFTAKVKTFVTRSQDLQSKKPGLPQSIFRAFSQKTPLFQVRLSSIESPSLSRKRSSFSNLIVQAFILL